MPEIRNLREDEIICRVQQVTAKGVMLLLYKDARCDMAVLDEAFTPFGWQRNHKFINDKEYCTVSVRDPETGEWVSKMDCGTESNTEKEKGQSSDAFKRACVNWGIGRELYTKIFIFISVPTEQVKDKYRMVNAFNKFIVTHIDTDRKAKKILKLTVKEVNRWGKETGVVFNWDNDNPPVYPDDEPKQVEPDIMEYVCADCGEVIKVTETTIKDKHYTAQELIDQVRAKSNDGNTYCIKCRSNHKKVMQNVSG